MTHLCQNLTNSLMFSDTTFKKYANNRIIFDSFLTPHAAWTRERSAAEPLFKGNFQLWWGSFISRIIDNKSIFRFPLVFFLSYLGSPYKVCQPLDHSIIICSVKSAWQTVIQLRQRARVDSVRHRLGLGQINSINLLDRRLQASKVAQS